MSQIEEKILEWKEQQLGIYCKFCSSNCCDPTEKVISFEDESLSLFEEKNIPVYYLHQLDKNSFKNWQVSKEDPILFRDGSEVQKPSIIKSPSFFKHNNLLYANICPFYDQEKRCMVSKDLRKPYACKKYPILFFESNDPEGNMLDIGIADSCRCLKSPDVKSDFKKNFPNVNIID